MKAVSSAIFLAAAIFASSQGTITRAADVDMGFFYDNLGAHGEWVDVPDYGSCWVPRSVSHDWRPYTLGHWGYTDDSGWTWISDEPFGWITYHYGRWVRLQDAGWCWVPDTVWGPAWVSFRSSDEYVGWAPLPPEAYFRTTGFGDWVDSYYDIGPDYYSFVPLRRFGSHNMMDVMIRDTDAFNMYSTTRNITRLETRDNRVFLGGLEYDRISSRLEQPIQRLTLERQFDVQQGARTRVEGNRLIIPSPNVRPGGDSVAPKAARRLDSAKVDRGWAQAEKRDPGKVRQLREQMKTQAQAPSDLTPNPKFDKNAQRQAAESATQLGTAQEKGTQQRSRLGFQQQPGQQRTQEQGTLQQGTQPQGQQPQGMQQEQQPPTGERQHGQQLEKGQGKQLNQPAEEGSKEGKVKKGKGKKSKDSETPGETEQPKGKSKESTSMKPSKEKSSEFGQQGQQGTQQQQQGVQQGDQQKPSRYGFQQQPGDASRKTTEPGANRSQERSTRYGFQNQPGEMSGRSSKQNRTQESPQVQPQEQQQHQKLQQEKTPQQEKSQLQEKSQSMQPQSSGGESQQGIQRSEEGHSKTQGSSGQPTGEEKTSKHKKGGGY